MGNKNQNTYNWAWQATTPLPWISNTPGSGSKTGTMASTNTIYTDIVDVTIKDNLGLQIDWTGTPTGTLSVMASTNGTIAHAVTFSPALAQPAGSSGGYMVDLNNFPWKYIFLQYVNASGAGTITAWITTKDVN